MIGRKSYLFFVVFECNYLKCLINNFILFFALIRTIVAIPWVELSPTCKSWKCPNILWQDKLFYYKNEINKINKQLRRAGSIILNCKRYEITTLNWSFCDYILFNFQGNFIDKIRKDYYETIVDNLTLNYSKTRCNRFIVPVIKNNIDLKILLIGYLNNI